MSGTGDAPDGRGWPPAGFAAAAARAAAPAIATAALLAASALWGVPLLYSTLAAIAIVVAEVATRGRVAASTVGAAPVAAAASSANLSVIALLEALPDSAFLLSRDGEILYGNPVAHGRFPTARPGDSFTLTFRKPDLAAALEGARDGAVRRAALAESGESVRSYAVTFSPVRPTAGSPASLLVTLEDVSERLAIERMRSDFVANASHELRTPLASLTGFIETLLGPARSDPAATEKFLGIMLDQARRMRRLLDDLLSLGRLEMRAHQRPAEAVDLGFVLRHVADALAPLAREHSVALTIGPAPGPMVVSGDRDELVQVFQNLLENAIRYGASGGKVEVSIEAEPPSGVAVHVRDHGPGIAQEHLPRLTERFYRVDVGSSRAMKGTGLGLAIVKHILVRHSGRLEIVSRPGDGARFSVHLPLRPTEPSA